MKVSILGVQVENFRTLQNVNIELAPITILTGANGAGKSSILKIFRLLQESYQKYELKKLAIESLDMGDWESVVSTENKEGEISIAITIKVEPELSNYSNSRFISLEKEIHKNTLDKELIEHNYFALMGEMFIVLQYDRTKNLQFMGVFAKNSSSKELFHEIKPYNDFLKKEIVTLASFQQDFQHFENIRPILDKKTIQEILKSDNIEDFCTLFLKYFLETKETEKNISVQDFISQHFSPEEKALFQIEQDITLQVDKIVSKQNLKFWEDLLLSLFRKLPQLTFENTFDHIGSLRANTKRIYSNNHDEGSPFNKILSDYANKEKQSNSDFVQHSLNRIGLAQDYRIEKLGENYAFMVISDNGTKEFNLADCGYGFAQFIPILLKSMVHYGHKTRKYAKSNNDSDLQEDDPKPQFSKYSNSFKERIKQQLDNKERTEEGSEDHWDEPQEELYEEEYEETQQADEFEYSDENRRYDFTDKKIKWESVKRLKGVLISIDNPDSVIKASETKSAESNYIPNSGHWFSIEEPESNLHPRLQSLLADFFMDLCKTFEVRVIIETHSEYLIRKLQELVADNKIGKDDALIYYFRNPEIAQAAGKPQVEKIEFSANGEIPYWKFDSGFYDMHESELAFGLLNLQRKKIFEKITDLRKELDKETGLTDEQKTNQLSDKLDLLLCMQDKSRWREKLKNAINADIENKLDSNTMEYMQQGWYLLDTNHKELDYSGVVIQFGRAVENELIELIEKFKIDTTQYATKGYVRNYEHLSIEGIKISQIQKVIENSKADSIMGKKKKLKNGVMEQGSGLHLLIQQHYSAISESVIKIDFKNDFDKFIQSTFDQRTWLTNDPYTNPNLDFSFLILPSYCTTKKIIDFTREVRNSAAHTGTTKTKEQAEEYRKLVIDFFNLWCSHLKITP